MPKKLHTNPKAQEARERKQEQKKTVRAAEAKAAEDHFWRDEGQSAAEKRKAQEEAKKLEEAKKREAKRLIQEKEQKEMASMKLAKDAKVTQFQLAQRAAKLEKDQEELRKIAEMRAANIVQQPELEENVNRARQEQLDADMAEFGAGNVIAASSLEEALEALKLNEEKSGASDRHPEKRLKAAYAEFEEKMMPTIKEENPGLRLSQYKQMLWKLWLKAPENPLNQATALKASKG